MDSSNILSEGGKDRDFYNDIFFYDSKKFDKPGGGVASDYLTRINDRLAAPFFFEIGENDEEDFKENSRRFN